MKKVIIPLALLVCAGLTVNIATAKKKKPSAANAPIEKFDQNRVLLFNSGFEDGTRVVPAPKGKGTPTDRFIGVDHSVPAPNKWDNIPAGSRVSRLTLQYEGGDSTMRWARIVPDPVNPQNKVLAFRLNEPNVGPDGGKKKKSRVQANVASEGIHELHESVRLYLHPHMEDLRYFPDAFGWLTLLEWWNNIAWGNTEYGFRISFGLCKKNEGYDKIYFKVDSQDIIPRTATSKAQFFPLWEYVNKDFEVPFGKWMTLDYYIKEGDNDSGRFYMTVTPDGGEPILLFDVHGQTYGTGNPDPKGFRSWHPMKLYTSVQTVNFLKNRGKYMEVLWDDLKIWGEKTPVAQ